MSTWDDLPPDPFDSGNDVGDAMAHAQRLWEALLYAAAYRGLPGLHAAVGALTQSELSWMVFSRAWEALERLADSEEGAP